MIRYNKSVIDWFLEQQLICLTLWLNCCPQPSASGNSSVVRSTKQLLSSDPVNNCILLASYSCGKHLHDRIILQKGRPICVHKTSLTPQLFIKVPVSSQESERSCMCVRGIDFVSFYHFGVWFFELFRHCGIFLFLNLLIDHSLIHNEVLTQMLSTFTLFINNNKLINF